MIYTVIVLNHQLVAWYGTKARCRAALVGGNLSDSACLLCGHFVGITSTRINSWVSRDVTSFAQISVRHVGVPRVSNLC